MKILQGLFTSEDEFLARTPLRLETAVISIFFPGVLLFSGANETGYQLLNIFFQYPFATKETEAWFKPLVSESALLNLS